MRFTRRVASSIFLLALGAAFSSGCSSHSSPAPVAAASDPASGFYGSYVGMPDENGAITRLSFVGDGTYLQSNFPCNPTVAACVERGTFTVDDAVTTITLVSSAGVTTKVPLAVLDSSDDPNDGGAGDDDDDDGGTTTTKDLVVGNGDAGAGDDDDGGASGGGSPLVNAALAPIKNVMAFTLSTSNGSRLFTHESPVENQLQTENCWIYTTMGWADALANYATPAKTHMYSEAYIYYWEIYEQLAGGTSLVSGLDQGGFWGRATWLATRYGMMVRQTFVSGNEATAAMNATMAINKSLHSGALRKTSARRNHALVRSELDKAFGLSASMSQTLTTVFGAGVTHNFTSGATRSTNDPIFRPADVIAEITIGYQGQSSGRLNQSIGTPDLSGYNKNQGPYAWSGQDYPHPTPGPGAYTQRFAIQSRIIAALNDGFPVPIIWYADGDTGRPDGTYQKSGDQDKLKPGTSFSSDGGNHVSLIADYEVDNVPGYGTLLAGSTRTQAQKNAAMATGTQVRFFRIKNSWGTGTDGTYQGAEGGYNDLYMTYLDGTVHVCDDANATKRAKNSSLAPSFVNCQDLPAFINLVLPPGY